MKQDFKLEIKGEGKHCIPSVPHLLTHSSPLNSYRVQSTKDS